MSEVNIPVKIGAPSATTAKSGGCQKEHCGCASSMAGLSPLEQAQARTRAIQEREALIKRGAMLQYASIGYNCLEAVLALVSGVMAGSIALVGFGLDSAIEVTSGLAALFRLNADGKDGHKQAEKISLRIAGFCFLGLAAYVGFEAASVLITHAEPERSLPGLILATVSIILMPWLARAKKEIAVKLGSRALETDSKQTLFCSYLSGILLVGLLANATLHWWWADSVAALVMVPIMAREGILALKGKDCCGGGEH